MPHRFGQMSDTERAFVADLPTFLKTNIVIVKRRPAGMTAGETYWSMAPGADFGGALTGRKKNRDGQIIPVWDIEPDANGGIYAYYLHYSMNGVAQISLGIGPGDPSMFITANLNGCSISHAQAHNAAAYLAHHNDQLGGNNPTTIEGQAILAQNAEYLHQADYRKVRSGAIDTHYEATVIGERKGTVWHFYCQNRKTGVHNNAGVQSTLWTLKGMKNLTP
jgi:hypothetical protein